MLLSHRTKSLGSSRLSFWPQQIISSRRFFWSRAHGSPWQPVRTCKYNTSCLIQSYTDSELTLHFPQCTSGIYIMKEFLTTVENVLERWFWSGSRSLDSSCSSGLDQDVSATLEDSAPKRLTVLDGRHLGLPHVIIVRSDRVMNIPAAHYGPRRWRSSALTPSEPIRIRVWSVTPTCWQTRSNTNVLSLILDQNRESEPFTVDPGSEPGIRTIHCWSRIRTGHRSTKQLGLTPEQRSVQDS